METRLEANTETLLRQQVIALGDARSLSERVLLAVIEAEFENCVKFRDAAFKAEFVSAHTDAMYESMRECYIRIDAYIFGITTFRAYS